MPSWGPLELPHTQRMAIAHEIAERLKERFHQEMVAIGLYGSLAREDDGPYSDIEMFGVMRANQYEQRYEWCTAAWKAEVDLFGKQTIREQAEHVDGRWPLTHSAFQTVLPLYDPEDFFAKIRTIAQGSPEPLFREAIENLLVDDVFECIGKIRNAQVLEIPTAFPALVLKLGQAVAMVVGLAKSSVLYHRNPCHLGSGSIAGSARWISRARTGDPYWGLTRRSAAGNSV